MAVLNLFSQHRNIVRDFNQAMVEYVQAEANAAGQIQQTREFNTSELLNIQKEGGKLLQQIRGICDGIVPASALTQEAELEEQSSIHQSDNPTEPQQRIQECISRANTARSEWERISSKRSSKDMIKNMLTAGTRLELTEREVRARVGDGELDWGHITLGGCVSSLILIAVLLSIPSVIFAGVIGNGEPQAEGFLCGFALSLTLLVAYLVFNGHSRSSKLAEQVNNLKKQYTQALYWYQYWLNLTEQKQQQKLKDAEDAYQEKLSKIIQTFHQELTHLQDVFANFTKRANLATPVWSDAFWQDWTPSTDLPQITRLGEMQFVPPTTQDTFSLPIAIPLPGEKSLLLKTKSVVKSETIQTIQSLLIRLLASIPPAKVNFTFLDPVGLGQNVAPFMSLADYLEDLVNSKAWSEPQHIEKRLAELTEHMENVIQKYLRGQYATIEEYNAEAGEVAEPYQIVVAFDFPVNFNDDSARRLVSVAKNGPRCGVYAVILIDTEKPLPHGFNIAELEQSATVLEWDGQRFVWKDEDYEPWLLQLDTPPDKALFDRIIQTVGEQAVEASKVEVPFERIAPTQEEWWTQQTTKGLIIPLGPTGARKVQTLDLGQGTAQHALVVGKTGSGKSTLLHTLITSTSLSYSPEEIEIYLIDFKKGVEFKTYATHRLPHARVIAIESEREFGISVLQGLDAELKRRGDLYRAAGVDNIANYRQKQDQTMSRILLLVDEFQEFFTEDDAIASQASQILDRLVRQGRAFGIHVLLGSQTLAGAYNLARSTIDQMAVRIALQCSEADSRLILSDDNPAARLLSRPGEAIYNSANGLIEGNNRFQVAWLTDEERDHFLDKVQELARERNYQPTQIIFEGNASAEVEKNHLLQKALGEPAPTAVPKSLSAWLGEPIAIQDPLAAIFRRQSGSNLLIVGQKDEEAMGMMASTLVSLSAQLPNGTKNSVPCFSIIDYSPADVSYSNLFQELSTRMTHPTIVGKRRQLPDMMNQLATEVQRRIDEEDETASPIFLFINGLQRARDLREEEDFSMSFDDTAPPSPARQLTTILREGPDVGVHTVVWCDTVTNLNRTIDRRALREFVMRVAFQMSAEDSSNLIDTPAASKIGQHRALFQNEEDGIMEKFRPYSIPSNEWLSWVGEQLKQ